MTHGSCTTVGPLSEKCDFIEFHCDGHCRFDVKQIEVVHCGMDYRGKDFHITTTGTDVISSFRTQSTYPHYNCMYKLTVHQSPFHTFSY